jgi:hypothetical protein
MNKVIDFVSDWWHLKSVRLFGDSFCAWNEAMELAKNSRTLNKRSRYMSPVRSYLVFVRSVLALFSTCTLTYAHIYIIKLTLTRKSYVLCPFLVCVHEHTGR